MPSPLALFHPSRPSFRPQRNRCLTVLAVLVLALTILVPGTSSARDTAARKFGRGVSNIGLGVSAIPGQIMQTTRESGPFLGATWGLAKGVGMTVATEVVGVFELLTCPFETPPDFKPIVSPEFPWQYFTESR